MLSVDILVYHGFRNQSGAVKEGVEAHLHTGFPVQKGHFLPVVVDGDYHTKGVRPADFDMVTGEKMRNQVAQSDANYQPKILLRALSNHVRDMILDHFNPANDASMLSRHHHYPITYLRHILHEALETWIEWRVRTDHG